MSVNIVNTHHAKTHLSQLLERVAKGEVIVIAKAGKPVAKLSAFKASERDRNGGQWAGRVRMGDDFDDPLPADIADAFGDPG